MRTLVSRRGRLLRFRWRESELLGLLLKPLLSLPVTPRLPSPGSSSGDSGRRSAISIVPHPFDYPEGPHATVEYLLRKEIWHLMFNLLVAVEERLLARNNATHSLKNEQLLLGLETILTLKPGVRRKASQRVFESELGVKLTGAQLAFWLEAWADALIESAEVFGQQCEPKEEIIASLNPDPDTALDQPDVSPAVLRDALRRGALTEVDALLTKIFGAAVPAKEES